MTTDTAPARGSASRRRWLMAVLAMIVFTGAFTFAGLAVPLSARAAELTVDQCNGVNGGPLGATTGLTCTVTVVNTISGGNTSSTLTVTRQCSLGPCAPGNGTVTTSSPDLVTTVTQCNGSGNDAAPPLITCEVTVTNNISADTPGANPVAAATVNQCVGSATGGGNYGGAAAMSCAPFPATTSGAAITQCNGSVTGGGSTAACTVPAFTASAAIPVRVNQCNGTGNAGGTLLTCRSSITTNITAAATTPTPTPTDTASATPTETASPIATGTPSPTSTSTSTSDSTSTSTSTSTGAPGQVSRVPSGGVAAGGNAVNGPTRVELLTLGGGLLLTTAFSALLGRRATRKH